MSIYDSLLNLRPVRYIILVEEYGRHVGSKEHLGSGYP